MEKRDSTWYVARRGVLLAEQFLLDLHPESVVAGPGEGTPFEFIAFFTKPDRAPVIIGIEVKATQQAIKGRYSISADQAMRLLHSNVPVLIIVVDVKTNEIYFNWVKDAVPQEKQADLNRLQTCSLHLRKSSQEEVQKLRNEILADRMLAVT